MKSLSITLAALALLAVGCVKGPKGDTGTSGRVVMTVNCEMTTSGFPAGGNGLDAEYTAVVSESGDASITAKLADGGSQVSVTDFYSSRQVGSQTLETYITYDINSSNGGYWRFRFDRATSTAFLAYFDGGSTEVNFLPSECSITRW